jgi:hypothetical protein
MAKQLVNNALSHWHKPYESFHTSAMEFYAMVETALLRRQIPYVAISRINLREGGTLSAKREYLRFTRQKLTFDLCAAPYGTGYFFSWWLAEKRPNRFLCWAILLGTIIGYFVLRSGVGKFAPRFWLHTFHQYGPGLLIQLLATLATFIVVSLVYWGVTRLADMDTDDPILAIPILGPLYERFFRPVTYYRVDTTLMFQSAVSAAVNESIDALTTAKGLRALTEDEKKPIMREFLRR